MSHRSKIALAVLMVAVVVATFTFGTPSVQAATRNLDPSCCKTAPVKCCYNPCIKYISRRGRCRSCYGCETQKIVMNVVDPCCCKCSVDVPMCIPACCKGEPCVSSFCGPFRGVVWYKWCCGFSARVSFSRCGDITVTYFGG